MITFPKFHSSITMLDIVQPHCSFTKQISIAAKGMLFGEYAVLKNAPAIAVTFTPPEFVLTIDISPTQTKSSVTIKSDFYPEKKIQFYWEQPAKEDFFYRLLFHWSEYLNHYDLCITIEKSFSPQLGFGSSSALIVAISTALFEYFFAIKDPLEKLNFWQIVRKSIINIQGRGSGYDVGVQLAHLLASPENTTCWSYDNKELPKINNLQIPQKLLQQYGCFLKTHIYSNTKDMLHQFLAAPTQTEKIAVHTELAQSFLQDHSLENVKKLMQHANTLAPCERFFPDALKLQGLFYKSMGAGQGDCVWVLCGKKELLARGFLQSDVAFAFEDT